MKPENILLASLPNETNPIIKLIDFGLPKYIKKGQKLNSKIGTPYYLAPEVLEGKYDKQCDLWSIGVITYVLLCGYPPFNAEKEHDLFNKILCLDYEFYEKEWDQISWEAKDFIEKLLVQDAL